MQRYAVLVAFASFLLIVSGAWVTNHALQGQAQHERAGEAVGVLTAGLALWIWAQDRRRWLQRLGGIVLTACVLDGVLGNLGSAVAHAILAQVFFAGTVAIVVYTSRGWNREPRVIEGHGSMRKQGMLTTALVLGQIALGAAFRHEALGILWHLLGAIFVIMFILALGVFVLHLPQHPALHLPAIALLVLTGLQVFFGLTVISMDPHAPAAVLASVAHVATGALVLAAAVVLTIQIRRHLSVSRLT